ncbi:MAG: hypothetical protein IBJ03_04300 [Gemmatimonadaceae bacterium]|nr:hypothetical protein [Gemmatimonadaceae bacterium]
MTTTPYSLASLTLVLGAPVPGTQEAQDFADFQSRAASGESVTDHVWARHEHAALDALTLRAGPLGTHTLLETMIGSILPIEVIVADVDRQWVRHADGDLYVALTIVSEDVRPRAAANTLHDPSLVTALNAVADSLAALDGRQWLDWSAKRWHDEELPEHSARAVALIQSMAQYVLGDSTSVRSEAQADDAEVDLLSELRRAIQYGRACAADDGSALARELRALRHVDPLRHEWERVLMDAFHLGALDTAAMPERLSGAASALPWLYVGKERTDRLKADPLITPRFRRELLARAFMTAYALDRLAPQSSALLAATIAT